MKRAWLILAIALLGFAASAQAAVLDLSISGDEEIVNTVIFRQTSITGQGSGNFDPFVRIQNKGSEEGYNTDGAVKLDTKGGPHTHAITLGEIPVATFNNTQYLEILLDAGETGSSAKDDAIFLNTFRIYLQDTGSLNDYDPSSISWGAVNPYFDLGSGGLEIVNIPGGSGKDDMYTYIPYTQAPAGKYFYFYSAFGQGQTGALESAGSFEEWGTRCWPSGSAA